MDLFRMQRYGEQPEDDTHEEEDLLQKLKQRIASAKPVKVDTPAVDEDIVGRKKKRKRKKKTDQDSQVDNDVSGFTQLGESATKEKAKVRRVLPKWLASPDIVAVDLGDQQMAVDEMTSLDSSLIQSLKGNGIQFFFPVQRQVIPRLLDSLGKKFYRPPDLCVSAPTGSGKTLAFVLPIVQALRSRVVPRVRALIILPVQDLATQVFKVFQMYSEGTPLKVKLVSGQKSFAQEQNELVAYGADGLCHSLADIVVATPGRIVDHIQKTSGFSLQQLRFLVVDEADRVMEDVQNDWLTHVELAVYSGTRTRPGPINVANAMNMELPLQKLLFSATLSQNPEKLQQMALYEPKLFTSVVQPEDIVAGQGSGQQQKGEEDEDDFVGRYTTPAELTESMLRVEDPLKKPLILANLIKQKNMRKALVFTKSIESAHYLSVLLTQLRLSVGEISSKMKSKRARILSAFKQDKIDILVCTDALARGIDIGQIDFVVSYDCPKFVKTYIHRVGRTARAGKTGSAITMVEKSKDKTFKALLSEAGKPLDITEEQVLIKAKEERIYNAALEKSKDILQEEVEAESSKKSSKKPRKMRNNKSNF